MITLVDCGCETKVHGDGSGVEIYYCPLHESAAMLLGALREVLRAYQQLMPGLVHMAIEDYVNINEAPIRAREAIAAAEGRPCEGVAGEPPIDPDKAKRLELIEWLVAYRLRHKSGRSESNLRATYFERSTDLLRKQVRQVLDGIRRSK